VFSRIAIVNRGEAAMRFIHAVRDLRAAGDRTLSTIALHTDVERHAMFVREADEAYALGPASARPYLDLKVLEQALVETEADAVWVGWGFVAEDPAFVELCDRLGVTFIGPSAEAMRRLGDKIGSKLLAEEVGVPVAPWSGGAVESLEDALATADSIGYPMMLKATAGVHALMDRHREILAPKFRRVVDLFEEHLRPVGAATWTTPPPASTFSTPALRRSCTRRIAIKDDRFRTSDCGAPTRRR